MQPSLIHLEHALPALAELGLDALVPLIGGQGFDPEQIGKALTGLAGGAEKRAARVLVAVSKATAKELLAWEADPSARDLALREAALASFDDAKEAVSGFFGSLGLSLPATPSSLVNEGTSQPSPESDSAPVL